MSFAPLEPTPVPLITPNADEFYTELHNIIKGTKVGERVRVLIPRSIAYKNGTNFLNRQELEDIMIDYRDFLGPHQFIGTRFVQTGVGVDVLIDICHFK